MATTSRRHASVGRRATRLAVSAQLIQDTQSVKVKLQRPMVRSIRKFGSCYRVVALWGISDSRCHSAGDRPCLSPWRSRDLRRVTRSQGKCREERHSEGPEGLLSRHLLTAVACHRNSCSQPCLWLTRAWHRALQKDDFLISVSAPGGKPKDVSASSFEKTMDVIGSIEVRLICVPPAHGPPTNRLAHPCAGQGDRARLRAPGDGRCRFGLGAVVERR